MPSLNWLVCDSVAQKPNELFELERIALRREFEDLGLSRVAEQEVLVGALGQP
jgi:hypothetical protein